MRSETYAVATAWRAGTAMEPTPAAHILQSVYLGVYKIEEFVGDINRII